MLNRKNTLTEWVDLYTDDLFRWAVYKTSNEEVAKDLVQDTFLVAANKIHNFKEQSSPKTWLMGILKYKIIDFYRQKVRDPKLHIDSNTNTYFDRNLQWKNETAPKSWSGIDDEHLLDDEDFLQVLKTCMDDLPEKWEICIKSKYLLNKKGEEICQDLEIAPTNFWQIIHRAKLKLRDCIENNWFNE